jgi:hypothetical protein
VQGQVHQLERPPRVTAGGGATAAPPSRPLRRVRHEVRDGLTVAAFSAAASTGLALALLLLTRLAG